MINQETKLPYAKFDHSDTRIRQAPWFEFSIKVTLKQNLGIFGSKRIRHEFKLCAPSRDEAVSLALSNVPSRGWPYDEREFQVVDCIPVGSAISDECTNGGCEDCNYLWCQCNHHSAVQFRAEHPGIRSLVECEIDREESAA